MLQLLPKRILRTGSYTTATRGPSGRRYDSVWFVAISALLEGVSAAPLEYQRLLPKWFRSASGVSVGIDSLVRRGPS